MRRSTVITLVIAALGAAAGIIGIVTASSVPTLFGVVSTTAAAGALAYLSTTAKPFAQPVAVPRVVMKAPTAPTDAGAEAALAALSTDLTETGVAALSLWLEDPLTSTLRHVAAIGEMRPASVPVVDPDDLLMRCIANGLPLLEPIARVGHTPVTLNRFASPLPGDGWRGAVAVDLTGDRVDRERLAHVIGCHRASLTAALDIHEARQRAHAAEALVGAASELFRIVDPDLVADALLDRVMRAAHADTGSIMLHDKQSDRLTIVVSEGLPAEVAASTALAPGEGIAGWVYSTGKATVVEDLQAPDKSGRHGVKSAIAVPLADREGIIGVVNVGSRRFEPRQAQPLIEALESLAAIGATAIRNAQAAKAQGEVQFSALRALALALETKDPHARGTTDRVHDLAVALGRQMGLSGSDLESLRIASLVHDIGMLDAIGSGLKSRRPLSTVEWALVKTHPKVATDLLEHSPALSSAIPIVFNHHERYDGAGYMTGSTGDAIPIGARILSVADAYIAMVSHRPYREAMTATQALDEIASESGTQFDPQVVRALERLSDDGVLSALSAN